MNVNVASRRRNWSREETMMAFALYIVLEPRECDDNGLDVQRLASFLHRTPDSVALKIWNIAAHDVNRKAQGKAGMKHGTSWIPKSGNGTQKILMPSWRSASICSNVHSCKRTNNISTQHRWPLTDIPRSKPQQSSCLTSPIPKAASAKRPRFSGSTSRTSAIHCS